MTNRRMIMLAASAFALALRGPSLAAELPAPGGETEIDLGAANPVRVYLPSNYEPTRTWPVLFLYHGQGGRPTLEPIRRLSAGRNFVIVGMAYADPETESAAAETPAVRADRRQRDLATFRRAREWVLKHVKADAQRLYLGGVSKGGWTASILAEAEATRLAGVFILIAGRVSSDVAVDAAAWRDKPVYVGAGETDPNLGAARRAAEEYRARGAAVSFEEFPGVGHAVPADAPRLAAWLDVEARLRRLDEPAIAELRGWFSNAWSRAAATTGPAARYAAFRDLDEDPRLPLGGPSGRAAVRRELDRLRAAPPARDDWAAEQAYLATLRAEGRIVRLDDMRVVRDGFQKTADAWPSTRWGRLARADAERVGEAYRKSLEATARANPAAAPAATAPTGAPPVILFGQPSDNRPRRGIPLIRRKDGKYIFDR